MIGDGRICYGVCLIRVNRRDIRRVGITENLFARYWALELSLPDSAAFVSSTEALGVEQPATLAAISAANPSASSLFFLIIFLLVLFY